MPIIDSTIRFGDIIVLLGYVITGIIFVLALRQEIKLLAKDVVLQSSKIDAQGEKIEKLEAVISTQAVQDQRLLMLEKTVEDLRRGAGWVQARRVVDGEYSP